MVKSCRLPVQFQKTLPLPEFIAVSLFLRHLQPGALGKEPHRVRKGQVFHIHNKLDSVAALFAAETVIHLPPRFHVKGRRFLAVKGA